MNVPKFGVVIFLVVCVGCSDNKIPYMEEIQVTSGRYGHMINPIQIFSPDDEWIVYDTRNDQTHIGQTCCIEKVNVRSGEVVKLYSAPDQTPYGPGVGAVAWHPHNPRMIFIHGLLNCDVSRPYGFTRRFGALLHDSAPGRIAHAEARKISLPLVEGALRGGTHAYSWSSDGEWISFTYNDFLLEQLEKNDPAHYRDLRTIGVMAPVRKVTIEEESAENFSGQYFAVVAATVTPDPQPGSDEIEKAFDECWVGKDGYVNSEGVRQRRAVAFQGTVKSVNDSLVTEVFIADIPDDITVSGDQPLCGTPVSRTTVPRGLIQRRLTFTENRKFPGIQGPRCWLRSSPDGASIYFLMKDNQGIVQIFEVPSAGGEPRQVTSLEHSIQAQFNVSPDGKSIALIAGNSIWLTDIISGKTRRLTACRRDEEAPVLAVVWNNGGNSLAFNKYVPAAGDWYLQIFRIDLH